MVGFGHHEVAFWLLLQCLTDKSIGNLFLHGVTGDGYPHLEIVVGTY